MPTVVLTKAEYQQPPTEGPDALDPSCEGRDCMPQFLLEGTCDGQPFACKVSFEIDGRDGDYEHISGLDMGFNSPGEEARERWDALVEMIDTYEPWLTKFNELSASYYE